MGAASEGSILHEPQCLLPLVEKTELLSIHPVSGRVYAKDRLPQILDENNVPRRVAMVRQVLDMVMSNHEWTGAYDLHHFAYEGKVYRSIIDDNGGLIGSRYRGAALLKAVLPRQLHVLLHTVYEDPPVPDIDTIRNIGLESDFVHNLFNTVRIDSYRELPDLRGLPIGKQEKLRKESLERKLDSAPLFEMGIMPDREYLASVPLPRARSTLRKLARASGFSNVPGCQEQFFASHGYFKTVA